MRVGSYRPPIADSPPDDRAVAATETFHGIFYDAWHERGTLDLHWFGYRTMKTPMDMWAYQEIVTETKPEVVIECGTAFGGSSLFFASLFDLLGRGEVITVDIEARPGQPQHPRISRIVGSSTDVAVVDDIRRRVGDRSWRRRRARSRSRSPRGSAPYGPRCRSGSQPRSPRGRGQSTPAAAPRTVLRPWRR
jgi:hypothetical protein